MPEPLFFGALLAEAEADFEADLEPDFDRDEAPDFDERAGFELDFAFAFDFAPDFERPLVAAIATSCTKKL